MRYLVTKRKDNSMISLVLMVRHLHLISIWAVLEGLAEVRLKVVEVALVDLRISEEVIHFLAEDLPFSEQRTYLEISLADGTRLLISWVMTSLAAVMVAKTIRLPISLTWGWEVSADLEAHKTEEEETVDKIADSKLSNADKQTPSETFSVDLATWEVWAI